MLSASTANGFAGLSTPQMVLFALGIVGLALILGSTRRRVRRSPSAAAPTVREQYESLEQPSSVSRDVEAVMLELDQLSRQIHGRIDTKIAKLEAVMRHADERIERLSRLLDSHAGGDTLDVTLDAEDPDPTATLREGEQPSTPHQAVYRLADDGLSPTEIARAINRTTGEVELILALRRAKQRSAYPAVSSR